VVDFIKDMPRARFDRPVMFIGIIGGHCLIPNVEFLLKGYDSEFLRLVVAQDMALITYPNLCLMLWQLMFQRNALCIVIPGIKYKN